MNNFGCGLITGGNKGEAAGERVLGDDDREVGKREQVGEPQLMQARSERPHCNA